MVGVGILVSNWLAPSSKNAQKEEAYECGIATKGSSWVQFRVGYYLFDILNAKITKLLLFHNYLIHWKNYFVS